MLEQVRGRLAMLAGLFTIMGVIGVAVQVVLMAMGKERGIFIAYDLMTGVLSLVVYLIACRPRLSSKQILDLAGFYECLVCLAISMGVIMAVYDLLGHVPNMTPTTVLIVAFPLMVPAPPRRTLFTALAAATMGPIALFSLSALGRVPTPATANYLMLVGANLFAVVLAVFGSRIIYGINLDAAQAQELGAYRLETRLGRGGMGEVWRARHRMLIRPAAIKLIRPDIVATDEDSREHLTRVVRRFRREAQVTATLESPHTIELFDFGVTEDGVLYYVMELLEGCDLETMVEDKGPMSPARVIHILIQVCDSLAEAHERGLVHRDIKPANIMLCQKGRHCDVVKVVDFGLVALTTADEAEYDTERSRLSIDGVAGTPAYMAPELASGASNEANASADLYALGCVAYWLLTGRPVFERKNAMAVIVAHAVEEPIAPSRVVDVSIPDALESLVMSCLAKDPAKRPQSAEDIIKALEEMPTASEWTHARARAWWSEYGGAMRRGRHDEVDIDTASQGQLAFVNTELYVDLPDEDDEYRDKRIS